MTLVEPTTDAWWQRTSEQRLVLFAALLTLSLLVARLFTIGRFDLFFDEAYYWQWSTNLAAGYFDHPPMVAYAIRLGTLLFGSTEFGVRFVGAVSLVFIVGLLYAIAHVLYGSRRYAAWAAILGNLTTISAVSVFTVPDQAQLLFWLAGIFCLSKIARGGPGWWWLAAGAMFGLSAVSKYTAFLLTAGSFLWVLAVPSLRAWLGRPWPYLGAAIALLILAPNIVWNATHGWVSFAAQASQGHLAVAAPLSFLSYLALIPLIVSPPIFVLAAIGAMHVLRERGLRDPVAALLWITPIPLVVYLGIHSLRDEVEFHWIAPLSYWACLLAPSAFQRPSKWLVKASLVTAVVFGVCFSVGFYFLLGQRFLELPAVIDIGSRFDGWGEFAQNLERMRIASGADYIIGDRYYYPGYMGFYLDRPPPVFHLLNPAVDPEVGMWMRWVDFPAAEPELAGSTAIFVGAYRETTEDLAEAYFADVTYLGEVIHPTRRGSFAEHAYLVRDPRSVTSPLFNDWAH